jgi:hypothetical protein
LAAVTAARGHDRLIRRRQRLQLGLQRREIDKVCDGKARSIWEAPGIDVAG